MFKRISTITFSILLSLMFQSTPLQAIYFPMKDLYFPTDEKITCYCRPQEERSVQKQIRNLDMIQGDDLLVRAFIDSFLEDTVDSDHGENSENKLIEELEAFAESKEKRLSVVRNILISLCNIGLSKIVGKHSEALCNEGFKALCNNEKNGDLAQLSSKFQDYKNYLQLGKSDAILDEEEENKLLAFVANELLKKSSDYQTNSKLRFLCNKVLKFRDNSAIAGFIFWEIILTKTSPSTLLPVLKLLCKDIQPLGFPGSWGLGYLAGRSAAVEFCRMQNVQMVCGGIVSGVYDILLACLAKAGISFLYPDGPTLTTICSIIVMLKLLSIKIGKFVDVEKLIKKLCSKEVIKKYNLKGLCKFLSAETAGFDLTYVVAGELLVLAPMFYLMGGMPSFI